MIRTRNFSLAIAASTLALSCGNDGGENRQEAVDSDPSADAMNSASDGEAGSGSGENGSGTPSGETADDAIAPIGVPSGGGDDVPTPDDDTDVDDNIVDDIPGDDLTDDVVDVVDDDTLPEDEPVPETCEPGVTESCTGPGCSGERACSTSGAWAECVCDEGTVVPALLDADLVGPKLAVSRHACAIFGTDLQCWGPNEHRQTGVEGPDQTLPVTLNGNWLAVATGDTHTCGIATDHSLWCWGQNRFGSLGGGILGTYDTEVPVRVGDDFVYVAAGRDVSCGVTAEGRLLCWGDGSDGMMGVTCASPASCLQYTVHDTSTVPIEVFPIDDTYKYTQVAMAGHLGVALSRWDFEFEGEARSQFSTTLWGAGNDSEVPRNTVGDEKLAVSVSNRGHCDVLVGGALVCDDFATFAITGTPQDGMIQDVGEGDAHRCVLLDGSIWCLGQNDLGQLGSGSWTLGDTTPIGVWQQANAEEGAWTDVEAGSDFSCARRVDDSVWCWGANGQGNLGIETTSNWSQPTPLGVAVEPMCDDAIVNGTETGVDCGNAACGACPTCSDALVNQDETGPDCGGTVCAARCDIGEGCLIGADCGCTEDTPFCDAACSGGQCVGWCDDADEDGYGEGPLCLGPDCTPNDPAWNTACSCDDGAKNQDETGTDCGGGTCVQRCDIGEGCNDGSDCGCTTPGAVCDSSCQDNLCVGWCFDTDGDGYGSGGPNCLGTDCDEGDSAWHQDCWVRDLFPPERPATVEVTGTVTKDDYRCVMVASPTDCFPQNDPACTSVMEQAAITLELTIDEEGNLTVEAPYQDMCAPDYFCAVTGPGCPVPTEYSIPTLGQFYYFDPRNTDRCRADQNGSPIQVQQQVTVTAVGGEYLSITQDCLTQMRDGSTGFFVFDTREWTTFIEL